MRKANAPSNTKRARTTTSAKKTRLPIGIPRSVVNRITFMPPKTRTTLKYCEDLDFTVATSGVPYIYTFSATDLRDPNITGTGHQPMGFDTMMSIYRQFVVVKSWVKFNLSTNQNCVFKACAYLDDDSVAYGSGFVGNLEQKNAQYTSFQEANEMKTLTCFYDAAKQFGESFVTKDSLIGSASTSPTEAMTYHIITDTKLTSTTQTCTCTVEIWYDVCFFEPQTQPLS